MGRHSLSYLAAQQEDSTTTSTSRGASAHVGRIGLLAVALGIGAAVAGGTPVASADTPASAASDDSATAHSSATKQNSTRPSAAAERDAEDTAADDDPASPPPSSLDGVRQSSSSNDRNNSESTAEPAAEVEDSSAAIDPEPPAPDDEAETEYGDIGKWMLESTGDIADYGGVPHDGKTVLEAVNVVIVDTTSKSSLEATWRLNAAMRRAGFPARLIHSTGFRGLIDGELYRQQPRGFLVGYSDDFFLLPNNHGRIFGPHPIETGNGYVWSGSFTREGWAVYQGLPRHAYVSSEIARDALASQLAASGRATLSGTVPLHNSYNTDTITTGDHDGYAVVITLNNLRSTRVATAAVDTGSSDPARCLAAGFAALSPCDTKPAGAIS